MLKEIATAVADDAALSISAESARVVVMQVTWSLAAGGSERYTLDVASMLDRGKFAPHICALDCGGPLEVDAQEAGIPYTVLNRRSGIDFRLMWRLYRLFRLTRASIVHTHHFPSLFYSFLGAKIVGARLVHTEHGLSAYRKRRLRFALRMLSRFCQSVVAVGTESERVLREEVGISPRKLCVIPGGVRTERFNTIGRAEARVALGLRDSDRVAVIVARLSPEKNHRMLLSAFREVRNEVQNARLLIVGEGPEQGVIAEEISRLGLADCVSMLGVRRDIPQILAACDVFLLSSEREALPIAALEAMAAGLPVVATDVGDLHTIVTDGVNGRLVPSGDAPAFAQATMKLMIDSDLSIQMGRKGKAIVQKFSVRSMVQRYESLYLGR